MTNKEILKLAKTCGFNPKDAGASLTYWECWERQLLQFAREMYNEGYDQACFEATGGNG